MAKLWLRVILFFGSFSPLFVLLAVTNAFGELAIDVSFIVIAVVGVTIQFAFLRHSSSNARDPYRIRSSSVRGDYVLAYIVTYVVPFLQFDTESWRGATALVLLLVLVAIVYVQNNLVHVNPVLYVFGYRIFEVECHDNVSRSLITKRSYISPDQDIWCVSLGEYILMEVSNGDASGRSSDNPSSRDIGQS